MRDQWDILQERLEQNYKDYVAQLQGKTPDELIVLAPEITAAQQLRDELAAACSEEDVEFLLRFADPLEAIRGFWADEMDGVHSEEIGHMIWDIRDRGRIPEEDIVPFPTRPDQYKAHTALPRSKRGQER